MDTISMRRLAERFADLGGRIRAAERPDGAMAGITAVAAEAIPHADAVAITRGTDGNYLTIAPTDDLAPAVDAIQYELNSGPCVDVALDGGVVRAPDLRSDERWPQFGPRAADEHGVLSMLSVRLFHEDSDVTGGLNFYATKPNAFDEADEALAILLAVYGSVATLAADAHNKVRNLELALESSRQIGIAMGILMSRFVLTKDQAFDVLRVASQHSHRKLREVALDVIETGDLELPKLD